MVTYRVDFEVESTGSESPSGKARVYKQWTDLFGRQHEKRRPFEVEEGQGYLYVNGVYDHEDWRDKLKAKISSILHPDKTELNKINDSYQNAEDKSISINKTDSKEISLDGLESIEQPFNLKNANEIHYSDAFREKFMDTIKGTDLDKKEDVSINNIVKDKSNKKSIEEQIEIRRMKTFEDSDFSL